MTFSLVARCAETGRFGMVISSSSPAVAARCAHLRAGVGAVASQNITDPGLGPLVLAGLAEGAEAALAGVTGGRFMAFRQLLVVDRFGGTAVHSGAQVLGIWGQARGRDCVAGGNLLADPGVPAAMVAAFENAAGALGDRLITALRAGRDAGGEAAAAEMFAPAVAPYVPPFILSSLMALTVGYALLVWCPRKVLAALFPGHEAAAPVLSAIDRRNANISAIVGLVVVFVFAVIWLRTLL